MNINKDIKKRILEAIKDSNGIKLNIANKAEVCRNTVDKYIKEDSEIAEAYNIENESCIDRTESKLVQQIEQGNYQAISFHLRTKGKNRGYVEKTEVENTHNIITVGLEEEDEDKK